MLYGFSFPVHGFMFDPGYIFDLATATLWNFPGYLYVATTLNTSEVLKLLQASSPTISELHQLTLCSMWLIYLR